jgi:hypothetical protein
VTQLPCRAASASGSGSGSESCIATSGKKAIDSSGSTSYCLSLQKQKQKQHSENFEDVDRLQSQVLTPNFSESEVDAKAGSFFQLKIGWPSTENFRKGPRDQRPSDMHI